jgi:hypothetical protein
VNSTTGFILRHAAVKSDATKSDKKWSIRQLKPVIFSLLAQ